jgi:phosphatidylserine/phosphatidylglycerophosphate/cardiolipin synthase-like enzyme
MEKVQLKAYCGTKMVLLAFNWEDGKNRDDFLGFAIKRKPGLYKAEESFLPNRISFNGPVKGKEFPSNESPIQKFMWWDNRFNYKKKDISYTYSVTPVIGDKNNITLVNRATRSETIKLLPDIKKGIGTYFNRAIVSSQAFSKKYPNGLNENNKVEAFEWLADDLNEVVPNFIKSSTSIEGAIYHLEDKLWIIPEFESFKNSISLVIDRDSNKTKNPDKTNDYAIKTLGKRPNVQLIERTKASIMHNKFLVNIIGNSAKNILMGSANFTTDGLTQQANYLHTFDCPKLAELYLQRKRLLEDNPTKSELAKIAEWSEPIEFNESQIRVYFAPENKKSRIALNPIIDSIKKAKSSVIFSLFSPTDQDLRNEIFKKADEGKMMFGLINKISDSKESTRKQNAADFAKVEIYHRSKNNKDVYGHGYFKKGEEPDGFWWEMPNFGKKQFPVYVHHKFILIDSETNSPILFTGSANMSNNSNYNNDENILEIKNNKDIAHIYLCEFLRLYEHYRARIKWDAFTKNCDKSDFKLVYNSSWSKEDFTKGTAKFKSRLAMVSY